MNPTNIRRLAPPATNKKDMLEVLESLKHAVETDLIVAFCCVGLEDNDETRVWTATSKPVTRLRMTGAISHLLYNYHTGENV